MEASVSTIIPHVHLHADPHNSEEEDPDDFPFPLTLKQKKAQGSKSGPASPGLNGPVNGTL